MIVFTKKDETLDIPQGLGNAQITLIEEAEHISRKEAQDMIDSAQWEAGAVTPSNVEKYVDSRLANLSTEMREWIEHTFVPREYVDGTFEELDRKYDERTNDLARNVGDLARNKVDNLGNVRGIKGLTQDEYDAEPTHFEDVLYVITCG